MHVKLTVEMEGTSEEVGAWLARLGGSPASISTSESVAAVGEFNATVADQLVRRITEGARRALRYMAENAPEVSWDDLQKHLGVSGIQIGGVMASFGFAENAGIPRPYVNDRARRMYRIDEETAEVVLGALDRFEKRNGQAVA
jgi:hypothetical protein